MENETFEELPHQQTCSRQLRNLIVATGIVPATLARAISVSPPTITKFLNGKASISMDITDRIFEIFNISLSMGPLPDLSQYEKPRGRPPKVEAIEELLGKIEPILGTNEKEPDHE